MNTTFKAITEAVEAHHPVAFKAAHPRNITPPTGYLNPKHFAAVLTGNLVVVHDPNMNQLPHLTGYMLSLSLIKHQVPTYFISPEFAWAVANTDLPRDFKFAEIHWPLDAQLFVLPDQFVSQYYGCYAPFLALCRCPDGVYPRALAPVPPINMPYTEIEIDNLKDKFTVDYPLRQDGCLLVLGSAPGLVTVSATHLDDANFNAAPYVERWFFLGTSPLPIITTHPKSQVANPGDRISFNVVATGEALAYQWRFDGQSIPGGTGPTLVLARVRASHAGPYGVIVRNPSGSATSRVAMLTVNILTGSPIILTQPQGQALRLGEGATLSVVASGATPNLVYQWYRGLSADASALILGATNASYTVLGLTTNTTFWVNVRNSLGMVDSDSALLTVSPANAARLRLEMFSRMPGLTIDGRAGTTYRIEYSTNLATVAWARLIDLSLPSNPFTFYDAGAVNTSTRFYRVLAP